jgi:NAD-dependent SIR2 family protein deacetylase
MMDGSSVDSIVLQGDTFDGKLASIARLLAGKKNIVVLAGAGISVSCGIPDFRSTTGLYNTLNYQELGLTSPEDLFDIETFVDDPRPFYKFAKSLYPGNIEPG